MIPSMVCSACGASCEPDSNLCDQCGRPLPSPVVKKTPAEVPPSTPNSLWGRMKSAAWIDKTSAPATLPPLEQKMINTDLLRLPTLMRVLYFRYIGFLFFFGLPSLLVFSKNKGLLAVGAFCACFIVAMIQDSRRTCLLHKRAAYVQGQVVGLLRGSRPGSGGIQYRFLFNRKVYDERKDSMDYNAFKRGNAITVAVDPDNPSNNDVLEIYYRGKSPLKQLTVGAIVLE